MVRTQCSGQRHGVAWVVVDDPLDPVGEAAVAAHEMFLALSRAGFTEMQALFVVAQVIVSQAEPQAATWAWWRQR